MVAGIEGDIMTITALLFGVFFIGCIAQFFVIGHVQKLLKRRHPDARKKIDDSALFTSRAVGRFIFDRGDKALHDPVLSRAVRRASWFYIAAIGVWALYGLSLFTGFGRLHIDLGQWPPVLR